MQNVLRTDLAAKLQAIKDAGLYKPERVLDTPQDTRIGVKGGRRPVVNLCANNYLGLANAPQIIERLIKSFVGIPCACGGPPEAHANSRRFSKLLHDAKVRIEHIKSEDKTR
jgi:7-keto-8-aminopelargonate synthetase-like enzyme